MLTTMKDIARDLGVSVVTVSKVLRNHEDIGEATRKRVLDRVKELDYTPNLTARGLVTGKTYLVGLVVPDLLHPFFAQVAKSLSRALLKKDYCLTISTSEEDAELEKNEINRLLGRRLDALVIASSSTNPSVFERIQRQGLPLVLIDRNFPELDANYVGADDEAIGLLATEHLIEIGCKRIAHLRGPDNSPGVGRLKGYQNALAKHKLKSLSSYVSRPRLVDVQSRESGADLMHRLLALNPRPDGVFCYNDPMAIGAIHAILDAGLSVPGDIAVIGSGNLHYDTELRIPLSSIDQQTDMIGERAGRLTLSLLESKTHPRNKTIIIQPQLVVRASTDRKAVIEQVTAPLNAMPGTNGHP
jgi:LacI family transcriptional regulator